MNGDIALIIVLVAFACQFFLIGFLLGMSITEKIK